jgi:hypothetical protein
MMNQAKVRHGGNLYSIMEGSTPQLRKTRIVVYSIKNVVRHSRILPSLVSRPRIAAILAFPRFNCEGGALCVGLSVCEGDAVDVSGVDLSSSSSPSSSSSSSPSKNSLSSLVGPRLPRSTRRGASWGSDCLGGGGGGDLEED